jgi:hypothetical protein
LDMYLASCQCHGFSRMDMVIQSTRNNSMVKLVYDEKYISVAVE